MALTLLTAAVLGVAASSGCVGDDCSVKEDGSILLQHRRKEVDLPDKGMAFEGGGFKAHAAHTGVMSGLLGAFYKASAESGEEPNLKKMMRNVKAIASNSGGTWFISQLVYSPSFLTLIETIAANPAQANKQYKEGWIERFLGAVTGADAGIPSVGLLGWGHDVSHPRISVPAKPTNWTTTGPCLFVDNNRILGDVAKIADPFLLNLAEVILEIFFLARNASSWEAVVSTLLQSTSNGDMTAKDTLGSKVNEWAEGKWWMAATSMATPGGTGPGNCHWYKLDLCAKALVGSRGSVAIYNGNSTDTKWLYAASTKPTVPNLAAWTPARFSTVLGGGDSEPAPLKFCDAYCDNLKLEYTALGQSVASQEL
ncbi:unnamed protein product [Symbiodinium natans]|uniref:Phospholipase B-like n=1 Tax=Symbiodinium natans TaxID=878477 RepID=A0A812TAR8_9DINO|nr:unnamed protein product [Symbiodinium natans]